MISFFISSQFLEDVREIMGIPEWFLKIDSRKTKLLYDNACIQLVIHFRGPIASRLEQVCKSVKLINVQSVDFFT